MKYIRERLGAKLFLANLAVILAGVAVLALPFRSQSPLYLLGT